MRFEWMWAALMCVSVTCLAQDGPEAAAKAAPTDEGSVDDAGFVAPEASMLRKLDLETARLERELKNTELKSSIAEAGKEKSAEPGGASANRGFPELLGVSSARGKNFAEFLVGDGVIEFTVGDWVTPEFKLSRIGTTSVELRDRKGRASQMAVGVSRPVQGAMSYPTSTPQGGRSNIVTAPIYPSGAVVVPSRGPGG